MLTNIYWFRKGEMQNEINIMEKAINNGTFGYTKTTQNVFNRYYRYYNDGDTPRWATGRDFWKYMTYGTFGYELNEAGQIELERRVTERIVAEWKRFQKCCK